MKHSVVEPIVTKKQGSGGESDVPMKNRKLIKKLLTTMVVNRIVRKRRRTICNF